MDERKWINWNSMKMLFNLVDDYDWSDYCKIATIDDGEYTTIYSGIIANIPLFAVTMRVIKYMELGDDTGGYFLKIIAE